MATEKRLIDANDLMKAIKSFRWVCVPNTLKLMFDYLKIIIRDQPTVDAVEVVHSQWDTVFYESHGTLASYSHICPVCKYLYRDIRFKGHKYCPNCGAKMDGDGNG